MNLLNLEDEKFKNVKVLGYSFKIKFISPKDRLEIARRRVFLQGGCSIEALTDGDYAFMENIAILDTCIEESPKDFPDNESSENWDSLELINAVAHEIRKHTDDIESRLKKNKPLDGGSES